MVKSSVVLIVVVGVATALSTAFLVVLCKCLWVWWKYKRHKHTPSKANYQSYAVTHHAKWPAEYTYQTYENAPSDVDSVDSEDPYIIETPGDYGKLQLQLDYNTEDDVLIVGVVQGKGVICKTNIQTAQMFPVVQIYDEEEQLLDERKIETQPMSFEPQWNEEVLFALSGRPVTSLHVHVRLHELDSFSNEHVIGCVKLPLVEQNLAETGANWYDLTDEHKIDCEYVGEVLLSLNYFPTTQRLTIVILKARNLKIENVSGLWGPLVKVFFHVNKRRVGRKRTAMQKKTFSPVYNEAFAFKVPQDALPKITFRVLVVNKTSHGQDEVIGHVSMGHNVIGTGFSHWNHMLTSLRKPVAMWHPIIPFT